MISFILVFPFDKTNSWWNSGYWHDLQIHSIHFSYNWTCSFHEIAKKRRSNFRECHVKRFPETGTYVLSLLLNSRENGSRQDQSLFPRSHVVVSLYPPIERSTQGRSSFAGPSISPCMVATRSATIVGRPPNRIMDHRCKRIEGSIIRRFHSGGTRNRSQNVGPNRVQITDPRFYYRWILSVDG